MAVGQRIFGERRANTLQKMQRTENCVEEKFIWDKG